MRRTTSKQLEWQSATIFTAVLIGAAASIAAMSSGCDGNEVILNNCPDAGASHGDDAGKGGDGGLDDDPYCD